MTALPHAVFHSADKCGLEGQSLVPCATPLYREERGLFSSPDADAQLKHLSQDASPIGTGGWVYQRATAPPPLSELHVYMYMYMHTRTCVPACAAHMYNLSMYTVHVVPYMWFTCIVIYTCVVTFTCIRTHTSEL